MNASPLDAIRSGTITRIHLHGDSITQGCGFLSQQQGYVNYLTVQFNRISPHEQLQIYNHAVGGATSVDGLDRIHWSDRENHIPHLTLMMFGLNDVHRDVSLDEYVHCLESMIGSLASNGSQVVVLSPTPYVSREDDVRSYRDRAEAVARQSDVFFIDCLTPFYATGEIPADFIWPDGIHLTAQGQRFLGEHIFVELERI